METGNVDVVLMRMTARELLAAFLNDLSNECLTRWGPQVQGDKHNSAPERPK
jgi:hypothetical protein